MTPTWRSDDVPVAPEVGVAGKMRAVVRGVVLILVLCLGILTTLLLRLFEKPICGAKRPWSGWITVIVCRAVLLILPVRLDQSGTPMSEPGFLVANHSSWLDIFALNAGGPLYFVSKHEVGNWPGIGFLARLTGTAFVQRDRREAGRQKVEFERRLASAHRLLFFPEGTSTDNRQVLPFKPTLFAALYSDTLTAPPYVQPVSVVYKGDSGQDDRLLAWWGDMDFAPHLMQVLATSRGGRVHVTWHAPLKVSDYADRKALAQATEEVVRSGHNALLTLRKR